MRACVCMKEEECHKLRNFISFRRVRQSRPESIINLNTQSKTFNFHPSSSTLILAKEYYTDSQALLR